MKLISIALLATALLGSSHAHSLARKQADTMELECLISSSSNSKPMRVSLQEGNVQSLVCDARACSDSNNWDIDMNYTGTSDSSVVLNVFDRVSGQKISMTYPHLNVESMIEFLTYNEKTGTSLDIQCEVLEINE